MSETFEPNEHPDHSLLRDGEPEGVVRARKKPRIVLTMEVTMDNADKVVEWITGRGGAAVQDQNTVIIQTLEGPFPARPGMHVICGVQGEFYSCDGEIYAETYEPAV